MRELEQMYKAIANYFSKQNMANNEQYRFSVMVKKENDVFIISPYVPIIEITSLSVPFYTYANKEITENKT
jgi:hypothetical protein